MASPAALLGGFAAMGSAAGALYYGVNVAKVFGGANTSSSHPHRLPARG
jgi:hypothetical protein